MNIEGEAANLAIWLKNVTKITFINDHFTHISGHFIDIYYKTYQISKVQTLLLLYCIGL